MSHAFLEVDVIMRERERDGMMAFVTLFFQLFGRGKFASSISSHSSITAISCFVWQVAVVLDWIGEGISKSMSTNDSHK